MSITMNYEYYVLLAESWQYEENRSDLLHIWLSSRVCAFVIMYMMFFVFQCCFYLFSQRRVSIYRRGERKGGRPGVRCA